MVSNAKATSLSEPRPGTHDRSGSRPSHEDRPPDVQGSSLDGKERPPATKTEGEVSRDTKVRRLERTGLVVSRALLRCHTEEPVLNDTCRLLVEEAGFKMAWVAQAEDGKVAPLAQASVPPDYRPPEGPRARALDPVRLALKEDRPRVARDLGNGSKDGLDAHAHSYGYASQCAVPMRLADAPGVLVVHSEDPQAFQAEEVALLWEIAGDLEHGVRRIREMALREEKERQLERAKDDYHTFYEDSPTPLFLATLGGRITSANHAFARLLGRTQAEQVLGEKGLSLYTIMTPPDKNRLFDQARTDGAPPVEVSFFRNDHRSIRASVSTGLVTTEDGPRLKICAQPLGEQDPETQSRSKEGGPARPDPLEALEDLVHRMNTAMTPIMNHAELALSANGSDKDRHLRAVQEGIERLARDVKDPKAPQTRAPIEA